MGRDVGVSGSSAVPIASPGFFGPRNPPNIQVFSASGTWTKPPGHITGYYVQVIGGGGGGWNGPAAPGAAGGNTAAQLGGGGGTTASSNYAPADLPATVAVTVGLGGAGGAAIVAAVAFTPANHGTDGGTSSFGAFISCPGGQGSNSFGNAGGGPATFNGVGTNHVSINGGNGGTPNAGAPGDPNSIPATQNPGGTWGGGAAGGFLGYSPVTTAYSGGSSAGIPGSGPGLINQSIAAPVAVTGAGGCGSLRNDGGQPAISGAGGDGGFPGQGGGGTGEARTNAAGGSCTVPRGGNGANGQVIVITYFG